MRRNHENRVTFAEFANFIILITLTGRVKPTANVNGKVDNVQKSIAWKTIGSYHFVDLYLKKDAF